jgi:hypothetical protein
MARKSGAAEPAGETLYRVREGFAIAGPDGFMQPYVAGALVKSSDPVATSHAVYLEPASEGAVEAATAAPGERRRLRLPSGRTLADVTARRDTPTGGSMAPHNLDPSDENSPASPFAPAQPAAGVVAPDVADEQNLAGGPKPDEVDTEQARSYVQGGQEVRQGEAETRTDVDGQIVREGEQAPPETAPDSSEGSTSSGDGGSSGEEYDPSQHTVEQVNAYLDSADEEEKERVLQAERDGQARRGIVG